MNMKKRNEKVNDKTIAAISTPPGKGGIAVIRISGSDAIAIGDRMFKPKTERNCLNWIAQR